MGYLVYKITIPDKYGDICFRLPKIGFHKSVLISCEHRATSAEASSAQIQ
jgi:hypothetical protein